MKAGDWINMGLLIIASVALFCTASALREQTRTRDFENYLSLKERFATLFRKLNSSIDEEQKFDFVELMNLFEATCHLYNGKVICGTTRQMVREYLVEMLPVIFTDEAIQERVKECFSGPDTFFNIRRFARTESLRGVPQQ
jgi:hypothetical protein